VAIGNNILKDSMDDELSNVQHPNLPTIGNKNNRKRKQKQKKQKKKQKKQKETD